MKIRVLPKLLREEKPALTIVEDETFHRTIRILGPSVLVQVGKQAWIETEAGVETE